MKSILKIFFFISVSLAGITAQNSSGLIYVDSSGRMRWTENNKEAFFFGINYSTPFAFSYRALKNKNIPHKEIIDMDVQQFIRLGLNAYRIHVWDREISDKEGNLIENEHIELLDYLISRLIENDIYIILTPIAWWGTGWPEPDIETPGFSTYYSKIESTTSPEVLEIHVNYLKQFVNHKNPYTGKTYKEEDYIIAYEIFNEPRLPENSDSVRHYVNTTVNALREEGITKPVFFNISENPGKEQWEGVASSDIEGISFQWYPTGLVKYSELNGNYLSNVMSYPLPDYTGKIKDKAKMVYEFDAADIGKSFMYPVMAHSFREAGMQWATMFCYDPTPVAQYNSEYSTHYLNLLYTPQKAIGFLIASHIFNNEEIGRKEIKNSAVIMGKSLSDYKKDLSLLNNGRRFYYTNDNDTEPEDISSLQHISGYGNSKVIKYDGRGAYFLDKINEDLWKLELFPDAVWTKDPFGRNGLDEPVARLIWKAHYMRIFLPGLTPDFNIYSFNKEKLTAADYAVKLEPGVYLITNDNNFSVKNFKGSFTDFEKIKRYGEFINEFNSSLVINRTPEIQYENEEKKIVIELFSAEENLQPDIYLRRQGWWNFRKFEMQGVNDFTYEFKLPEEISSNGILNYFIAIGKDRDILTFPGRLKISPESWAFNPGNSYKLSVLPSSEKILIYSPQRDINNLISANIWRYAEYRFDYTFDENSEEELSVSIRRIRENFPELAFQIYIGEHLVPVSEYEDKLEFEIKSLSGELESVTIRVLYDDLTGFERKIPLTMDYNKASVSLSAPEKFKFALLPRPYPTFLPYWYESEPMASNHNNPNPVSVQLSIPLREKNKKLNSYGIKLKKINLIKNNAEKTESNK